MRVKVKDFKKEPNEIRICLNMTGINIDYQTADLIHSVLERMKVKGDQFSLKDGAEIEVNHEQKWERYFKCLAEKDAKLED